MHRLSLLVLLLPLCAFAGDWPQHFGPNRDGVADEKETVSPWGKDGPKQLWSHNIGSGWSAPIVKDKRVYLHHRKDEKEVLDCLDVESGKVLWSATYPTNYRDDFNFDDGPRATPAIAGDAIFTLGADGDMCAFALKDGSKLWQRNVIADYKVEKGYFGAATSPLIVGDKLLLNVGAKGSGIVAFDTKSGKEIWKVSDQGVSYSSPVVAKIDGEDLAVFFTRQGLYAITADKGELRYEHAWRPRINASVNAATPLVSNGDIFLTTSYSRGAVLLHAEKGKLKEIWNGDDSLSCHYNTPVLFGESLFGIDGRQEGGAQLRCIDWKTGKVR